MKQMRLITHSAFTYGELEAYRQLVFANLVTGMRALVECLPDVGLSIEQIPDIWAAYQVSSWVHAPTHPAFTGKQFPLALPLSAILHNFKRWLSAT